MKLAIAFVLLMFNTNLFSQEMLTDFEARLYRPQKNGLKDLVFDMRVEGIKEILDQTTALGKKVDVTFTVYWNFAANAMRIEAQGLPRGYDELELTLKSLVKDKIDFVLPVDLNSKFNNWKFKFNKNGEDFIGLVDGEVSNNPFQMFQLIFDKSSKLKSTLSMQNNLVTKINYFYEAKELSGNKFLLNKLESITGSPGNSNKMTYEISYKKMSGFVFPEKMKLRNETEYLAGFNKQKKPVVKKSEKITTIQFSNFHINSGKAQRFFEQGR